jgi:hypothetical protein
MTEIVVPLLAFLSISVFLAHAFDAYRTGWSHETEARCISFEPFPKSADLFMKRAVPYPPLPQKRAPHPQAGLSLFGRGLAAPPWATPRHIPVA